MKVYKVASFSLGDKHQGDKIVFNSIVDMEQAYKDIDNGLDIYVQTEDGEVTKLLHQMVSSKIYDGSIRLSARPQHGEMEG